MRLGRCTAVALLLGLGGAALGLGLTGREVEASPPALDGVKLIEAWPLCPFNEPIAVGQPADGTDTLYVLEQPGLLKRIAKYRGTGPVPTPSVALDLASTGKIHTQAQGGALGLAFHPKFKENGRFYLSYLSKNAGPLPFKLVVSEFRMNAGASSPTTERVVLEVPKTLPMHQAGGLGFDREGKLYIGVGDNASPDDRDDNAQNPTRMLGKILRIDVDTTSPGKAYGIPTDNPWAKHAQVLPEIWAYGFRNPWRFSWDGETMWLAEPGSKGAACREWVTQVVRGGNHGWPFQEGNLANPKRTDRPRDTQFVPRAFDYGREDPTAGSCAIGGRVYRGDRVKFLQGRYVFCDYEAGDVYALTLAEANGRWSGSDWRTIGSVVHCVSIDADAQGELYFCSNEKADSGGAVYTLAPR
jgi:predicted outer membrane repeat protein